MTCALNLRLLPIKLFYGFFYGGNSCVSPFLAHYLQEDKGLSPVDATTILASVPFLAVLTKPLTGHLADRTGRHRSILFSNLIIGTFFLSLLPVLPPVKFQTCVFPENPNNSSPCPSETRNCSESCVEEVGRYQTHFGRPEFWLILFCIVVANSFGLKTAYTIMDAVTLGILTGMDRIHDYGRQRMWMAVGLATALLSVSLVMDRLSQTGANVDYRPAFLGFTVCSVLSMVCVVFVRPQKPVPGLLDQGSDALGGIRAVLPVFRRPKTLWFSGMSFVLGMNFGKSVWLSPFYLKMDLAASQTIIAVAVVSVCLSTMGFFFIAGRAIARFGCENILLFCLFSYGLRALFWSFLTRPWQCLPVELLFGLSIGLWLSTMGVYASHIAGAQSRASAQSLLSAIYDGFGVGMGNLVSGRLYQHWGGAATWRFFSAVSLSCALLYAIVCFHFWNKPRVLDKRADWTAPPMSAKSADEAETRDSRTSAV